MTARERWMARLSLRRATRALPFTVNQQLGDRHDAYHVPRPGRVLLAYFSRPGENYYGGRRDLHIGNAERLASMIAELTEVDCTASMPPTTWPPKGGAWGIAVLAAFHANWTARQGIVD